MKNLTQHYLLLQLAFQGFRPVSGVLGLLPGSCCLPLQATINEATIQLNKSPFIETTCQQLISDQVPQH